MQRAWSLLALIPNSYKLKHKHKAVQYLWWCQFTQHLKREVNRRTAAEIQNNQIMLGVHVNDDFQMIFTTSFVCQVSNQHLNVC